jgi:hypothetical protein
MAALALFLNCVCGNDLTDRRNDLRDLEKNITWAPSKNSASGNRACAEGEGSGINGVRFWSAKIAAVG